MNLALVIAVWKRHDLERIVIDNFKRQSAKYGFQIIIAGSEGDSSKALAEGCHYLEVPNKPVSNKHLKLSEKAKELDVDGVVLMGSDDIVNDEYWDFIYSLSADEESLIGLKDFYFYDVESKELAYWGGYRNGKQTAGAGRFFSRKVLEQVDWKLWRRGLNKGLDSSTNKILKAKEIGEKSYTMDETNAFLVDVKHTHSITSKAIIGACNVVNSEIMAKKLGNKVVEELDKLEQPKPRAKRAPKKVKIEKVSLDYSKEYVFIANNVSKHLKSGKEYNLDGRKAEILINKGYGKLK